MRRISVGDIMTRNLVTCSPKDTLHDCSKKMAKERINSILITEKNRLLGILTARDVLWAITKKPNSNLKSIRGIDIATRKLAVIKPSADISQALEKMRAANFRRLPVISNGELIGVVTLKDILAIEPGLYHETRSLMDSIKEEDSKLGYASEPYELEGLCENCGAFSNLLKVDGSSLCEDCREEMY
ncbi:MAG: CBS domain-containing protein [Nanoarchaeota archaeon]|nr:CBS domain-containing protein [Nanoarchaeota archaeon]